MSMKELYNLGSKVILGNERQTLSDKTKMRSSVLMIVGTEEVEVGPDHRSRVRYCLILIMVKVRIEGYVI